MPPWIRLMHRNKQKNIKQYETIITFSSPSGLQLADYGKFFCRY